MRILKQLTRSLTFFARLIRDITHERVFSEGKNIKSYLKPCHPGGGYGHPAALTGIFS